MPNEQETVSQKRANEIISDWDDDPANVAQTVIEKYGTPDEATPNRLIWLDNGPWKRSVMHREGTHHEFPHEHTDYFIQTIDYQVDPEMYDDLGRFDGSVVVHRTRGELSAACHGEPANFLALNLAHDILEAGKSAEDARQEYAEIIAIKKADGSHPYIKGFQFDLPEGDQADPDETIITDEMKDAAKQQVESQ